MAQASETDGEPPDGARSSDGAIDTEDAFDRCTEFTTEHGLEMDAASEVFGAFVCPGCAKHNPLTGNPADFEEQTVRCMGCTGVIILDETALIAEEWEDNDD